MKIAFTKNKLYMKNTYVCCNEIIALLKFDNIAVSKTVWHVLIKRLFAQFDSDGL